MAVSLPIQHNKIFPHQDDADIVAKTINSGYWACGEEVKNFEQELSSFMGRRYAVCVSSGLSALRLALWVLGVKENDEVIIPAYSCVALANAALQLGAVPIPVDVISNSWILDPISVKKKISVKTKAIIVIHIYGYPANLTDLLNLGIPVIEDCAHGFGQMGGEGLGNKADIAITSFYATKFLGAGEGGAILLDNSLYAGKLRKFRDYTDQPLHNVRSNDKMTDIEASLARNRLRYLYKDIEWRQNLAEMYYAKLLPLSNKGFIKLPDITTERFWYRFTIITNSAVKCITKLRCYEIFAGKPAENWLGSQIKLFPVSCYAYKKIVSLPFHAGIEKKHVEYIVDKLNAYLEGEIQYVKKSDL